jgi:hypothetical protein
LFLYLDFFLDCECYKYDISAKRVNYQGELCNEICPICLMEFVEDKDTIEDLNCSEVIKILEESLDKLKSNDSEDIVHLNKCLTHFIHSDCLLNLYKSSNSNSHIRCPSCL